MAFGEDRNMQQFLFSCLGASDYTVLLKWDHLIWKINLVSGVQLETFFPEGFKDMKSSEVKNNTLGIFQSNSKCVLFCF